MPNVGKYLLLASTFLFAVSAQTYAQAAASANNTVVQAGTAASIVDSAGNTWTIANGTVQENGKPAGYSKNVIQLAYVNGTVWQQNSAGLWWSWNGHTWTGQGTPVSPVPAPAQTALSNAVSNVCGGAKAPSFGILPLTNNGVGQIFDTSGRIFVPRGVGVMEGQEASAAGLHTKFPGLNFVRYAIYDYKDPASLAPYVTSLTKTGIVVELENHRNSTGGNAGGSEGVIFTGQTLQQESNWYASIASYFESNPYVWFGTNNEPSEAHTPGGPRDPAALSQWQLATYNAIRNAGNGAPILLALNGWADPSSMGQGYDQSVYSKMYNVLWDMHVYGWLTKYNTDQGTNDRFVSAAIKQAQTFTSSGGVKMAVLIGEYGNSTTGQTIDPNGQQIVQSVQNSVLSGTAAGSAAWAWTTGNPGNGLLNGGGLSSYGQQVAAYIQQHVATPAVASTGASCDGNKTPAH